MREHGFAVLTSATASGILATHLPLIYRANEGLHGAIYGHVSSRNPQAAFFDGAHQAMAVFSGPHAYVSPMLFDAPDREVPTWDYVSVQAVGHPTALPPTEAERLIGELVDALEGADGWSMSRMKQSYRDKLIARVTPFRMPIETLLCVRKLQQGRSREERQQLAARFQEAGERAIARALIELDAN